MSLHKYLNCFWWVFASVCILMLVIIEFTDWRLFYHERAEKVNELIVNMSFSYLAACIFYILNEIFPRYTKRKVAKRHVEKEIREIRELLRQIFSSIEPFRLEKHNYTRDEFVNLFEATDLIDNGYYGGNIKMLDAINERKARIESICNSLLSSYIHYLNHKELIYIDKIAHSQFILNSIEPIEYSIPIEYRIHKYDNQREIGECIYNLYSLKY